MIKSVTRFFCRFRHPISLPEEVASALGIQLSNFMTVNEVLGRLASPQGRPTLLERYMPREDAEALFTSAIRKERFCQHTLFSYCFGGNWMEFVLQFDDDARLRRIYVQHKDIHNEAGLELPLKR